MKWISGWAYPNESLRALAEQTAGFPILGSWSLGSFQSLELAVAASVSEQSALVLVASTPRFCATDGWEHGLAEANLRAMQRSFARDPRTTLENFHKLCAAPATLSPDELAQRVEASMSLGVEALSAGLQKLRETDLRARVGEVRCPVLLLHGEEDRVIPVGASRWLAANIPDAKLVTLAGAGHDLPIRRADWVMEEVAKFVGALS